jgi:tRNA isopentenyl-2-thiomethyl-A-37 hydroxylase MiaE
MIPKITKFFFFDLMVKVRHYEKYWTLEEVWNNKELIEYYFTKSFTNHKVYGSDDILENIKT